MTDEITEDTLFELPTSQGQLTLRDMKEAYPTFTKYMLKKGVTKYYTLNPINNIYDYRPEKQFEMFDLMGMNVHTFETGEDVAVNSIKIKKVKATCMYFSPDIKVKQNAIFRDVPFKGYNLNAAEFVEEYGELAQSFDGTGAEGYLNYFFVREKARNKDDGAIYSLQKGDKGQQFYDLLRDAEEEADKEQ